MLALGLAVAACAAGVHPAVLKAWVGKPATALEAEWGTPTRETQDGDVRVLVYEEVERRHVKTQFDDQDPSRTRGSGYSAAAAAAEEAYKAPRVYVRSYLFWVNREGTIVHSAVRTP
jgi:hypothetical protein